MHRDDTVVNMSPTVLRDGPFRLLFLSREDARVHSHVTGPDGEAKFWLTPVVSWAVSEGLSAALLRDAEATAERHLEEIRDVCIRCFGG